MCVLCGIGTGSNSVVMDVTDSRIFRVTCPQGHEAYWLWDADRFEILYELGALALVDGYHREAVLNFYGALETFYGFFARLLAVRMQIDLATFEASWKLVSKQVERQIGFCASLYLAHFGRPMDFGFNLADLAKIRNDTAHAGFFPSEAEATSVGKHVMNFITRCAHETYQDPQEAWSTVCRHQRELDLRKARLAPDTQLNAMSNSTMLRFPLMYQYPYAPEAGQRSAFDVRLEEFKNGNYRQYLADRLVRE